MVLHLHLQDLAPAQPFEDGEAFPAFGAAMPSAVRIVTALASAVPSLPLSMSRMRPSNDVASVKSMPKLPVLKLPRTFTRGRT